MAKKKLRFAALIRVSTEKQAEQGSSLQTQTKQLKQAVGILGGTISEWYGGQEHATPGWEKKEVTRLLKDAQKKRKPFDAVIVQNADRWSRDNEAGERGLTILQDNKIQFFVGSSEYNLFNPEHRLFLTMSTAFGAFQARHQSKKSIENRIERAKQGMPACGKLPFGRIYDHKTNTWKIDKEKQKFMKEIAARYLAGESLEDVAEEYGVNHSNLHKNLTKRCGTIWVQKFEKKDLNICESVNTKIPALLPAKTIQAIQRRVKSNRTVTHKSIKNDYLLKGVIFCSECGYALYGDPGKGKRRCYRHFPASKKRQRSCPGPKYSVKADDIEDAVMRYLFHAFGNPKMLEEALEKAIPDIEKQKELEEKRDRLQKQLDSVRKGRKRIVKLLSEGKLTEDEDVEGQLDASAKKVQELQRKIDEITVELLRASSISAKDVKRVAKSVSKYKRVSRAKVQANAARSLAKSDYSRMTYEEKKALIEQVFSGITVDGMRCGIYVDVTNPEGNRRNKVFRFQIVGNLVDFVGTAPMDEGLGEFFVNPDVLHGEQMDDITNSASYLQDRVPLGFRFLQGLLRRRE